jgi:hypothetical protein
MSGVCQEPKPLQATDALSDSAPVRHLEDVEDGESLGEGISLETRQDEFVRALSENSLRNYACGLGVNEKSLRALGIGFGSYAFTFPMRQGGRSVGFRQRTRDGSKLALAGGHLGLFVPENVTGGNCRIITEGESDTAAALTLGFSAVGRPGAMSAPALVIDFFRPFPTACPCIIGDNDENGLKGVENLAVAMATAGIACRKLFPPSPHKDLRDWLALGQLTADTLAAAIDAAEVIYPAGWTPGFFPVPNAPLRRGIIAKVGEGPFCLLCLLASFNRGNGNIFPERETLAGLLGKTVSTVDRYKKVLERAGLLKWRRGHTGRCNEYRVDFGPCKEIRPRKKKIILTP